MDEASSRNGRRQSSNSNSILESSVVGNGHSILRNENLTQITTTRPNWWDILTFGHYTRLILKGFRRVLTVRDLVALPKEFSAETCWRRLDEQWRPLSPAAAINTHELSESDSGIKLKDQAFSDHGTSDKLHEATFVDTDTESKNGRVKNLDGSGSAKDKPVAEHDSKSLSFALMKAFKDFIIASSLLELLFCVVRLLPVYVISEMIQFVGDPEAPPSRGYVCCAALLGVSVVTSLTLNHLVHWGERGGLRLRSALMSAIYRKCLVTSSEANRHFSSGDLMNLMSVDTDNLYLFSQTSTVLWGGPLRILSTMAVIWWFLGPSCLAGLAVIVAGVPVAVLLSNATARAQNRQMIEKDKRLDLLNEILSGIKILKLYAWEKPFLAKVSEIRKQETRHVRKVLLGQAGLSFVWYCSPFLVAAAALCTYVAVSPSNVLTADKAFVSLFLFNNMRFSLLFLPIVVTQFLKCLVSLERIRRYLCSDNVRTQDITYSVNEDEHVRFENACLSWGGVQPTLSDLNLTVRKGELIAVIGRVGAGKSSLLNALLGEMRKLNGFISISKGSIGYVPQQAWIQNATIQQNITFTAKYDSIWYQSVLKECCLMPDLQLFPAGDQTEVGENGVNLSGGQKQRISIARAVYQRAAIYLMDDPLSAVDAGVSADLFDRVIGPNGLLKDATRILVTHSISILPFVDRIVVLEGGRVEHVGTFKEILNKESNIKKFLIEPAQDDEGEDEAGSNKLVNHTGALTLPVTVVADSLEENGGRGTLITDEETAIGTVKWSVYGTLLKYFRIPIALACLFGFVLFRVGEIYSGLWLSEWSEDGLQILRKHNLSTADVVSKMAHSANLTAYRADVLTSSWYRASVFIGIGGVEVLSVVIASLFLAAGCISASTTLHREMLFSIVKAPMSFFDSTPLGRILNRFGKDIDTLDFELYIRLDGWLDAAFQAVATIILICIKITTFIIVGLPIVVAFLLIQKIYMCTSRQLRRFESITRSPVLSNFSETINGVSSIRAYRAQEHFIRKLQARCDLNQNCYLHSRSAARWVAIRTETLASAVAALTCVFIVLLRDQMTAGVAGLVLTFAVSVYDAVSWMIQTGSDVENSVVAAERIKEYIKVKSEAPWTLDNGSSLDDKWPGKGRIDFSGYSTRYRPEMDLVLKNISLAIQPADKVGIVGRTGAGKSSLALAVFRIIEATDGDIVIDNVDTSGLGLQDLRSRLTVIPQDPVLFRGSLRFNLDPHSIYSDEELWSALEKAHLKQRPNLTLDYQISEGGSGLSVGERQLVCLARALLRKSKVLLLDEATAAVDVETDVLIQETIRRDFKECTVMTIAHRLNTVLDYDTIVVLSDGRIIEKGPPRTLMRDTSSQFYLMAKDAGLV